MAELYNPLYPLEEPAKVSAASTGEAAAEAPTSSFDHALLPLAMAFVPAQLWGETYEADTALARGTLFPALDKPFRGESTVRTGGDAS